MACMTSATLSSVSIWLVPRVVVLGRSVLGRRVMHGTCRYVVSSWMPPESVTKHAKQDNDRTNVGRHERLATGHAIAK